VVRVTEGDSGPPEETPAEEVGAAAAPDSSAPTDAPTVAPRDAVTDAPTVAASDKSPDDDSFVPTHALAPTDADAEVPTDAPTVAASDKSTDADSFLPTLSFAPTDADTDTDAPTDAASESMTPTESMQPSDLTDDGGVNLHIPGACTLLGYYPLYCSKKEASNVSPEGIARFWEMGEPGLWMPLLDPLLMLSGVYKGDAPMCNCEKSTKVDGPSVATRGENAAPSGAAGNRGGMLIQFLAAVLMALLLFK